MGFGSVQGQMLACEETSKTLDSAFEPKTTTVGKH